MCCDGPDLFLCVLAILFPPVGVWVKRGICSADSFINIALCVLGYLPGLLHAWYIICSSPEPGYEPIDGTESQVHVYYVRGGPPPPSAGPGPGAHSTPQGGYGTLAPNPHYPASKGAKQVNAPPASRGPSHGSANATASSSTAPQPSTSAAPTKKGQDEQAGPSEGPPPSYAEVVQGDHKIQSHE